MEFGAENLSNSFFAFYKQGGRRVMAVDEIMDPLLLLLLLL